MTKAKNIIFGLSLNFLLVVPGASAQDKANFQAVPNDPGITMALFPVKTDPDGKQFVITPMGFPLPIPGDGLPSGTDVLPVYRDKSGVFWFVDKNSKTVKVTHKQIMYKLDAEVNRRLDEPFDSKPAAPDLANQMSPPATNQATTAPQTTVAQQPPVVINNNEEPSSNSSGNSAAVAGMAGMTGAMAGAAIGSAFYGGSGYYGAPYYHPMYHNGAGYYAAGHAVNWAQDTHAAALTDQWAHQRAWNGAQDVAHNEADRSYARQNAAQNHGFGSGGFRRGGFGRRR